MFWNCENWYNIDKKIYNIEKKTLSSGNKINIKTHSIVIQQKIYTYIHSTIWQWVYTNYFTTQEILFNFLYFLLDKYWRKEKDIKISINSGKNRAK